MQQRLRPGWEREKPLQPKVEIKRLEIRSKQPGKRVPEQNEKPVTALSCLVSDTETCSPGTELLCHLSEAPGSGSRR